MKEKMDLSTMHIDIDDTFFCSCSSRRGYNTYHQSVTTTAVWEKTSWVYVVCTCPFFLLSLIIMKKNKLSTNKRIIFLSFIYIQTSDMKSNDTKLTFDKNLFQDDKWMSLYLSIVNYKEWKGLNEYNQSNDW
jgi:hypothetical protein